MESHVSDHLQWSSVSVNHFQHLIVIDVTLVWKMSSTFSHTHAHAHTHTHSWKVLTWIKWWARVWSTCRLESLAWLSNKSSLGELSDSCPESGRRAPPSPVSKSLRLVCCKKLRTSSLLSTSSSLLRCSSVSPLNGFLSCKAWHTFFTLYEWFSPCTQEIQNTLPRCTHAIRHQVPEISVNQ